MTIPVVCPHCDSTYQLAPDLAGKAMRCPNPDCREVFTVTAAAAFELPPPLPEPEKVPSTVELPAPKLPPPTAARDVAAVVPVLEGEVPYERVEVNPFTVIPEADPAGGLPAMTAARLSEAPLLPPKRKPPTAPRRPDPPARPTKPAPPQPAAGPKEKVWAGDAPPAPKSAPKEVDWSAAPPPGLPAADDADFVRTKRPRKRRGGLLLGSLVAAVLLVGGAGAFTYVRFLAKSEERAAAAAEAAYKDANYPAAKSQFEELAAGYPDSKDAERYRFFAALSGLQAAVGSVTLKEDPGPARKAFDGFADAWGQHPLAQPESGFGADVLGAGKKLADGVADHGENRLKEFRADRTKLPELDAVEQVARGGLELLPRVDKFRDRQAGPLDAQRGRYDGLLDGVKAERHRLAVLGPFRDLDKEPTALRIEQFQTVLKDNKLDADDEAVGILNAAEKALWRLIRYTAQTVPARPPAAEPDPPVLFGVAPADRPEPKAAAGAAPGVVFAVGRGVLTAHDAATGAERWAVRVAPPTADPQALDVPARVGTGDGEWVLVAGQTGHTFTLTARVADTGQPVWQQPLEALAAGRAVVAGGRVYLPLRDPLGTVAEFTLDGARTGQVQIRQPVGAGLAVAPGGRPGQAHLFVPGDAKRVFVFEVGREDAVGRRLAPRPVKALLTDHPRDALRCEPVVAAGGDGAGPRTLVLCQGDAPTVMKVRAFALPPAADWAETAAGPADAPTARPAEVALPGWAWAAPATDGERLVLATDAPAVLAFGLQQPGTLDRPVFALPGPKPAGEQDGVNRSQVVAADEDGCWAVLAGQLQRLVVRVDPVGGLALAPGGSPVPVGEPLHRPQVRGGLGVVVARLGQGGAVQATGFDLAAGRVRWQRRLGLTPAGPAVATGAGAVLADEDGAVYLLPDAAPAAVPLAPPYPAPDGKAVAVAAGDGAVWVLAAGLKPDARQLRVRRVAGGKLTDDRTLPLPAEFAGPPVAFGPDVLLPLGNGTVFRLVPGADRLAAGPLWRGAGQQDGLTCFLSPVGPDEFAATDGGGRWLHWKWPAGSKAAKVAGPYSAADPLAAAPVRLDAPDGPRFLAVDVKGVVGLYDPAKLTAPVKRWTAESGVPAGKPTDRPLVVATPAGVRAVVAVDRRHLVAIDPAADAVAWAVEAAGADAGELAGWRVDGTRVIATDLTGRVQAFDAATGKLVGTVPAAGGATAAAGQAAGVVVYADGTGGRVKPPQ